MLTGPCSHSLGSVSHRQSMVIGSSRCRGSATLSREGEGEVFMAPRDRDSVTIRGVSEEKPFGH